MSLIKSITTKIGATSVPVKSALTSLTVTKDKLMQTRNAILSLLESGGLTYTQINGLLKKYGLIDSTVPAKKLVPQNYNAEWANLWKLTNEAFVLMLRPDLAEKFRANVEVFTEDKHPIDYVATLVKGVSHPIAVKAEEDRYAKLKPLVPVLKGALKDKGIYPPDGLSELAQLFYNVFIAQEGTDMQPMNFDTIDPAWKSHLDSSIVDAIVAYANDLANRKQSGEVLGKTADKIATTTIEVKEKLAEKAEEQVGAEIGKKLVANKTVIFAVVGVVVLVLIYKAFAK